MPGQRIATVSDTVRAVRVACLLILAAWSPGNTAAQGAGGRGALDLLSAITNVRAKGCGGEPGTSVRLRPLPALDDAARRMAQGGSSDQAARAAGYRAVRLLTINLSGPSSTAAVANGEHRLGPDHGRTGNA